MAYSDPLAFFLTWSTYGSWLPGDERGWTDTGRGYQLPNSELVINALSSMNETACYLDSTERKIVEDQVAETCQHRGWTLHAINCRTNHVHVVVSAPNVAGDKVRDDLKAWCTRRLKEKSDSDRVKWWTERGSIRKIFEDQGLSNAVEYVVDVQDRKGRDLQ